VAGSRLLIRAAAACALSALLVAIAGGGQGFWLCLPATLLLAASARGAAQGAFAGFSVAVAGYAAAGAGAPSPALLLLAAGGSIAVVRVIQLRFERERRALRASALRDPLTGVANRRAFVERIRYEVARHTRQSRSFAVLALDLDGFKLVNDRFGHQAGDELLRDVAGALEREVREQDTVARLGGDEFYVLAPETDRRGGQQLAARVSRAVSGVTSGLERLSASVGLAIFPDDGASATEVIEAADAAALHAKRRAAGGRGRRAA
jgi:diguanylate cyclase